MLTNTLKEICNICGKRFGLHSDTAIIDKDGRPRNACPVVELDFVEGKEIKFSKVNGFVGSGKFENYKSSHEINQVKGYFSNEIEDYEVRCQKVNDSMYLAESPNYCPMCGEKLK